MPELEGDFDKHMLSEIVDPMTPLIFRLSPLSAGLITRVSVYKKPRSMQCWLAWTPHTLLASDKTGSTTLVLAAEGAASFAEGLGAI